MTMVEKMSLTFFKGNLHFTVMYEKKYALDV